VVGAAPGPALEAVPVAAQGSAQVAEEVVVSATELPGAGWLHLP
jgi:hypothetical protein